LKIMLCGKGGSGKSTVAVLMARALAGKGYGVVLVDSDESNTTLYRMLGTSCPRPLVEYLGGRRRVAEALIGRNELDLVRALSRAGEGVRIEDLPPEFVAQAGGVRLVVVGKIREFGEGCACPLNFLTKVFLKNLMVNRNTVVIVDTDAGVEHVGRGVEEVVDVIVAVVDPTYESLVIAKTLMEAAKRLGKEFRTLFNKVSESLLPTLLEKARELGMPVDGWVSYSEELALQALRGEPVGNEAALREVENFLERIGL